MRFLFALLLLVCTPALEARLPDIFVEPNSGIGAEGYDVTTYQDQLEPMKGSSQYSLEYQGVTWYFVSDETRERFALDPEKYLPAYGGYCAWAVSHGKNTGGRPDLWFVYKERLYFFCSQSALDQWLEDPDYYIGLSEQNWPGVLDLEDQGSLNH